MIDFSQDEDLLHLQAEVLDAHGNPTTVDSATWESSNNSLCQFDQVIGGGLAQFTHGSRQQTGVCQVTLSGDADLGAGVVPISVTVDVNVAPGQGASITIVKVPVS